MRIRLQTCACGNVIFVDWRPLRFFVLARRAALFRRPNRARGRCPGISRAKQNPFVSRVKATREPH